MSQNALSHEGTKTVRSRSPKGERTVHTIIEAAIEVLNDEGLGMASQENIAKVAGISQSTLRHYFPTKDELLRVVFLQAFTDYRKSAEELLLEPISDPIVRMARMVSHHLDFIMEAKDAYIFESYAHLARNQSEQVISNEFYRWILRHYASLIQQINPALPQQECENRAFLVLINCHGAWMMLSRSRPDLPQAPKKTLKECLMAHILQIIKKSE